MANTKISQLPSYTGNAADLRWFVMNNSGETETFKYSGYSTPYKYNSTTQGITEINQTKRTEINTDGGTNTMSGNGYFFVNGSGNTLGGNDTYHFVVGKNNIANYTAGIGNIGSFIFGQNNSSTNGRWNSIFGWSNNVGGLGSQAFGDNHNVPGTNAACFGNNNYNGGFGGLAVGSSCFLTGELSNVFGNNCDITNNSNNSGIWGGLNNLISSTEPVNTILGGNGNTITGGTHQVMIGCSGRTADTNNTTYLENVKSFGNIRVLGNFNFGNNNTNTSTYGGIAGGENNNNSGIYGFIGAGTNNNNPAYCGFVGGYGNTCSGDGAVVFGGSNNNGSTYSAIIGGIINGITGGQRNGILGGLQNNLTNSTMSAIIAGDNNTITSTFNAEIIGGNSNSIDNSNHSQILNGTNNTINCEVPGAERYNTIISGSGNTIFDASDDQTLQTIIGSIDTTFSNGTQRVSGIGLSGRTINDGVAGTTYVENLKAFRQVASGFYDNGSIPQAGYTINLNNGDKQQITITANTNTIIYFTGNLPGGRLVLKVVNTSTGGLQYADNAPHLWRIPALTPSSVPTASATDIFVFESFGNEELWLTTHSENLS